MIDSFNIVASVINVVVSILHNIRLLLNDLQKFKNAFKVVKRLEKNEHFVKMTFNILQTMKNQE